MSIKVLLLLYLWGLQYNCEAGELLGDLALFNRDDLYKKLFINVVFKNVPATASAVDVYVRPQDDFVKLKGSLKDVSHGDLTVDVTLRKTSTVQLFARLRKTEEEGDDEEEEGEGEAAEVDRTILTFQYTTEHQGTEHPCFVTNHCTVTLDWKSAGGTPGLNNTTVTTNYEPYIAMSTWANRDFTDTYTDLYFKANKSYKFYCYGLYYGEYNFVIQHYDAQDQIKHITNDNTEINLPLDKSDNDTYVQCSMYNKFTYKKIASRKIRLYVVDEPTRDPELGI